MTFPNLRSGSLELNDISSFERRWNLLSVLQISLILGFRANDLLALSLNLQRKEGYWLSSGDSSRGLAGFRAMTFSKPFFLFPLEE